MDEFIAETGVDLGIENTFQPCDYQSVAIGMAEPAVAGQPEIDMVADPQIDCHQGRPDRKGRGRQKSDAGALLDGIEHHHARIRRNADDSFKRIEPQDAGKGAVVLMPAALFDDPMVSQVGQ